MYKTSWHESAFFFFSLSFSWGPRCNFIFLKMWGTICNFQNCRGLDAVFNVVGLICNFHKLGDLFEIFENKM